MRSTLLWLASKFHLDVQKPGEIEYKYIILDENNRCVKYESGDNRRVDMTAVEDQSLVVVSDMWFRSVSTPLCF